MTLLDRSLRWTSLALITTAACGGSVKPPAVAPPAACPAPPTTPTRTTSPTAIDERCTDPCRFLTEVPLAGLAATVEARCGATWQEPSAACDGDEWYQVDDLRACIFASYGHRFDEGSRWASRFPPTWAPYDQGGEPSPPSEVAMANIAALEQRTAACDEPEASVDDLTGSTVWQSDLVTVAAAYTSLRTGGPLPLPAKQVAELRAAVAEFGGLPRLHHYTSINYEPTSTVALRRVSVALGGDPDCLSFEGEDCEGGTVLYFDLDRAGKLVGVSWQQSG